MDNKMTRERLKKYNSIKRQINSYEERYSDICFLSAVDTSKPSVQSFNCSDSTADNGIKLASISPYEVADYKAMCKEFKELNDYIFSIKDTTTKEIFKRVYIYEQSFRSTAYDVGLTVRAVHNQVRMYLQHH